MARSILDLWIRLERVHCYDEGDGWGSAEPYLWPVFFKIDGDTVSLTESLTLSGTATVMGTYGSHGNLVNTDVDPGEEMAIPEALGAWHTTLKPIPTPAALSALVADLPGVAGVVAVLMEEDNVSDGGAVAGYNALVGAIQSGLNGVIGTLGVSHPEVTQADMDAIQTAAANAVANAIQSNQSFFANLWSAINVDDQIGAEIFRFDHDALATGNVINFNKRWANEGDWEISGIANASELCPADAANRIVAALFGDGDKKSMRLFRDQWFPKYRGMAEWWSLAERNSAPLAWLFKTNADARESLRAFAPAAAALLLKPGSVIPDAVLGHAERILAAAMKVASRRLRIDASRALALLKAIHGRSVAQAVEIANAIAPQRRVTQQMVAEVVRRVSAGTPTPPVHVDPRPPFKGPNAPK